MVLAAPVERVQDYFLWRQEDAHRNSLNSHCYWLLRKQGASIKQATDALEGKSVAYKNELLFKNGINFDSLPSWQKRGIGLYWASTEKEGLNPITGKTEIALRRTIKVDAELPLRTEYASFIEHFINYKKLKLPTPTSGQPWIVTSVSGKKSDSR